MFPVQLDHVEAYVRDLDRAVAWYEAVLGLKVIHRCDPDPVMIGAAGTMLALFRLPYSPSDDALNQPPTPIRWDRVAWRTDAAGFLAAQARLRELGVTFRGPVNHHWSESIYFKDLDGHALEVTHYFDPPTAGPPR